MLVTKSDKKFVKFLVENAWIWIYYILFVQVLDMLEIDLGKYCHILLGIEGVCIIFTLIVLFNTRISKKEKNQLIDERYIEIMYKSNKVTTIILNTIVVISSILFLDYGLTSVGITLLVVSFIHQLIFSIAKVIYNKKM